MVYHGDHRRHRVNATNHYRAVLMNYTQDLSEDWAEMIEDFNSKSELVLVIVVLVVVVIMGGFVAVFKMGWFR